MKTKPTLTIPKDRSWLLVIFASLFIIIGIAIILITVTNIAAFGWWSLFLIFTGLVMIASAVLSIIRNESSILLLGILWPK